MNLDDPDDRDVAAAEYVMGTLVDDERGAFEHAMTGDVELRRAVSRWQDRLVDLARRATPVEPAGDAWDRIERGPSPPTEVVGDATLVPETKLADDEPFWNRVGTWRVATGLAMAAALVFAILLALRGPAAPGVEAERYLAVLQSPGEHATGRLVEAVAADGVRLVPVGTPVPRPPGTSLQFWTRPDGARAPTSLGLVHAGEVAVVPMAKLPALGDRQLFEVTLEPAGGSTIGRPTGPVLYVGSTVRL